MALNYTPSNSDEAASSFAELVVLPKDSSLHIRLQSLFGNETDFTGEFLLERFGKLTVSALLSLQMFSRVLANTSNADYFFRFKGSSDILNHFLKISPARQAEED